MTPTKKRAAPHSSTLTTPAPDEIGRMECADRSTGRRSTESDPAKVERRPAKRRSLEKDQELEGSELLEDALTDVVDRSQYAQHDMSTQQDFLAKADENMWRSMIRQDSLPPEDGAGKEEVDSDQVDEDQEMTGNDPTDEHQEFDSILESEGFSMVSVSSLPSAQPQSGSSISHQSGNHSAESRMNSPPAQVLASVLSHTSSQIRTPSLASSTSSMPPPPLPSARPRASPRPLIQATEGTPKLARVVRAGIALQGVLSPGNNSSRNTSSISTSGSSAQSSSAGSSKDRMDNLFDGFGAGTRRELRAGLRLGEELAKRQQRGPREKKIKERVEDDVFSQDVEPAYPRLPDTQAPNGYILRMPGQGQRVEYPALRNPQLPSPAGSIVDDEDRMSWKASSPVYNDPVLPTTQQPAFGEQSINIGLQRQDTPQEVRWQREREAISRQIEEANTSQVMVIDSDEEAEDEVGSEDGGDDDGDIWQEEADSSGSIRDPSLHVADALLQAEPSKPRRSKLPSSWRRNSQVVYSDEIEHAEQEVVALPKKEAVKAIEKGEAVKQQLHEKPAPASFPAPIGIISANIAPTRRQVRIEGNDRAVERPGWKPVKGRLQTPAKKTLRNVLAQQYDEDSTSNISDEDQDEDISDCDQEVSAKGAASSGINSKPADVSRGEHMNFSAEDALVTEEDTSMTLQESKEYESELERTKPIACVSRTPPGSPPQHLVQTLYLPPAQLPSTSWLGSLTSYIPTIRTPASNPVPNAENLNPAKWNLNPFGPLYTHLPFDSTHFRVFRPYFEAQMAKPGTYPFNPYSPSAALLNTPLWARNNYGWVRYLSKSDLGLVDKFMQVLRLKGVERRPGLYFTGDEKKIEELDVAKKLFDLWQDGVMHGICRVEVENGNRIGNVPHTKIPVTPGKIKSTRWKRETFLVP